MKLTGAQITRMDEALRQARYYSDEHKDNEPQRHRIEILVDDIMRVIGIELLPEGVGEAAMNKK